MTEDKSVPSTLRLKPKEQDLLRAKSIEINKMLITNDHAPMTESELAHMLLELTLKHVKADKDGRIFVDL